MLAVVTRYLLLVWRVVVEGVVLLQCRNSIVRVVDARLQ
jgi:hypothetical protein